MDMNFDPHKCVIFLQTKKIGTLENKAIRSKLMLLHFQKFIIGFPALNNTCSHTFFIQSR